MGDREPWVAHLSDGTTIGEDDPALRVDNRSPWKTLCALCRKTDRTVTSLECIHGHRILTVEAKGAALATGLTYAEHRRLGTGLSVPLCYRWIVRECADHWQWHITDGISVWRLETTPGEPGYEEPPSIARPDVDKWLARQEESQSQEAGE